jgi:hypothetical protein
VSKVEGSDDKEIAIPQLNYNYTFKCNGKEAPEAMVEWMKREPHYADNEKCVIVDKSLICISGTASDKVFAAGQKLSNEFQVFLVDAKTGWVCIGRKSCESSVWDTIRNYGEPIAKAVFEGLKMTIRALSNVLNFTADKVAKLPLRYAYKTLDYIKTGTKRLFNLQKKAFLMLGFLVGAGIIARELVPGLITSLGLEPFAEAASFADTSAVLLKHKDVLPQVLSETLRVNNLLDVAPLGLSAFNASMITQLQENVTLYTHVKDAVIPTLSDKTDEVLDSLLTTSTPSQIMSELPRIINPLLLSYLGMRLAGGDWSLFSSSFIPRLAPGIFTVIYNFFKAFISNPSVQEAMIGVVSGVGARC